MKSPNSSVTWALSQWGSLTEITADGIRTRPVTLPRPTGAAEVSFNCLGLFLGAGSDLWTFATRKDQTKALELFRTQNILTDPEYENYLLVREGLTGEWEVRQKTSLAEVIVPYMFSSTEGFLLRSRVLAAGPTELHWTSDGARTSTLISELPR